MRLSILDKSIVAVAAFACLLLDAAPARAEIVFFADGRHISVKDHRSEGQSLVFTMRTGGEIVCDAALVARIEPDEVPHPDEEIRLKPDPTSVGEIARNDGDGRDDGDVRGIRLQPDSPALQTDARYDPLIQNAAARYGVDAMLVRAVIQVESNYEERARSSKGARGLMQLMPATARQYGVSNPYDPVANIDAGIKHLKSLLDRFPLELALAAYNAGEAAVTRSGGIPPNAETRNYVARILRLMGRRSA